MVPTKLASSGRSMQSICASTNAVVDLQIHHQQPSTKARQHRSGCHSGKVSSILFLVWYGLVQIYSPGTQKNWESFKNHHHQRSRPPMKPKNLFVVDESPALRSGTAVTTLRLRDRMNLKKAFVDTSQHLLMF